MGDLCLNTIESSISVKAAAFSVWENPDITLKSKNIMGVVFPEIESTKVRKGIADRGYGIIGTTPVIDDTTATFEELVEGMIKCVARETTTKCMLDEMEREELFRLKKIKARSISYFFSVALILNGQILKEK